MHFNASVHLLLLQNLRIKYHKLLLNHVYLFLTGFHCPCKTSQVFLFMLHYLFLEVIHIILVFVIMNRKVLSIQVIV